MKSVRLHAVGDLQVHDEPVPAVREGEKLIRVKAVGVCGSDLHWFSEAGIGDAKLDYPLVLGHEFAGETEEGQRVAVEPALSCGHCEFCARGNPNLCSSLIFAGHSNQDGALREYMPWSERNLFACTPLATCKSTMSLSPLSVRGRS